MKQVIEWEVIYGLELLKYIMAYMISTKQGLECKKKTIAISFLISLITILSLRKFSVIDDVYILLLIIAVISLFACMKERISERVWRILVIFLSVTAIDSVMESVFGRFVKSNEIAAEHEILTWEVMILVCMAIVISINTLMKRCKKSFAHELVQCAVIFADICLCMCASYVFQDAQESNFHFWLGALSFIGVVFLGSQIFIILEMNKALKDAVIQEKLLNGMQKDYYQSILRTEDETRKYRHDMNNHFMVIETYLKKNKLDEMEKYINGLKESFSKVSRKKYNVGNDVIDAISGYYLPLIDDFVDIDVHGYVPDEMDIDDINLCTIYSNLLKNAVEELQRLKLDENDNLKLKIDFVAGKDFFGIEIKNTAKENAHFDGIKTSTSKDDKKDHGIGLSNIKRALDKENGDITLSQIDGTVCADVIIPISRCAIEI